MRRWEGDPVAGLDFTGPDNQVNRSHSSPTWSHKKKDKWKENEGRRIRRKDGIQPA